MSVQRFAREDLRHKNLKLYKFNTMQGIIHTPYFNVCNHGFLHAPLNVCRKQQYFLRPNAHEKAHFA